MTESHKIHLGNHRIHKRDTRLDSVYGISEIFSELRGYGKKSNDTRRNSQKHIRSRLKTEHRHIREVKRILDSS